MDSSTLYDPIRREWVAATPEEKVRQHLIRQMVAELGYPASLIAVEKSLNQLPHLVGKRGLPNRRADILCFGKEIHPEHELYPLLLIECKAVPLTDAVVEQVVGYNHHVGAFFIGIVNASELKIGHYSSKVGRYSFSSGLPSYNQLLSTLLCPSRP